MAMAAVEGDFIPFEKQLLVRYRVLEDVKQFTMWHQVATFLKLLMISWVLSDPPSVISKRPRTVHHKRQMELSLSRVRGPM